MFILLIAFEGIDGSGKSTHLSYFSEKVQCNKITHFSTDFGQQIKPLINQSNNAFTDRLLFMAEHEDLINKRYNPNVLNVEDRDTVISNIMYWNPKEEKINYNKYFKYLAQYSAEIKVPDFVVVFFCDYEKSKERIEKRNKNGKAYLKYDYMSRDEFNIIKDKYLSLDYVLKHYGINPPPISYYCTNKIGNKDTDRENVFFWLCNELNNKTDWRKYLEQYKDY